MRWDEAEARMLAGKGHALLDRGTVARFGGGDDSIQRRVTNGTWSRVHPGVYYLNVTRLPWRARIQAAVLAAGPDALASHRAAGRLWGLDGFDGRVIEITVPYSKLPEPAGVIVHRTRRPLPGEVVEGVSVTNLERTLLDAAATFHPRLLEKALRSALHLKLTTSDRISAFIGEQGGRGVKGTRKLRRTIEDVHYDATGSPAEVDLIRLIRSAPIPSPICQFELLLPDNTHAYPDFAWPGRRKFVEVDGFEAHGTPQALERDLVRQNMLLEMGWEMRRYSAALVRRDPNGVLRDLIRFIGT